jgi:hypothetical protein
MAVLFLLFMIAYLTGRRVYPPKSVAARVKSLFAEAKETLTYQKAEKRTVLAAN